MIAFRVADGVRSHFIHRLPEWLLSVQIGSVGLRLMHNNDTFLYSSAYRVIARHTTEDVWGGIALSISLFWLIALVLNGTFAWFSRCSKWVRSLSSVLACGFWLTSTLGLYEGNPLSPAYLNNAGYAVAAFVVSLITAREVGVADQRARNDSTRSK